MGFFDAFIKGSGDPDKDAAFNRGLIAAGLQLMQARGRLFPAIGQAGAAGIGAADQMLQQQGMQRRSALQDQMLRMQAEQFARQAQVDALPGKFMRQPSEPAIDATGGMETAVEAPQNASGPGGFDMAGYLRALQGMDFNKYLQTAAALKKELPKRIALGKDQRLVNEETGAELVPAMAHDEKDAFVRMMKTAGIEPTSSQGARLLQQYLTKQATHPAPVSISNYGSPLPIKLPGGGEGYIQPPTRPGGPSQILTAPGSNVPVQKPGSGGMTDAQAKANLFGTRAQEADKIIGGLAARGVTSPSLPQQLTGGEGRTGQLATALASPAQQQVDQAQRDFINAVLRRESGAVISPAEFENARRQYFVQPGDAPQVIAQKARNRQVAIGGILAEVPEERRGAGMGATADNDPLGLRK